MLSLVWSLPAAANVRAPVIVERQLSGAPKLEAMPESIRLAREVWVAKS